MPLTLKIVLINIPALPTTTTISAGQLNALPTVITTLQGDNGGNNVGFRFQDDTNLVVYDTVTGDPLAATNYYQPGGGCLNPPNLCNISFRSDGELIYYFDGNTIYSSFTAAGEANSSKTDQSGGVTLQFQNTSPYLLILDQYGNQIWNIFTEPQMK